MSKETRHRVLVVDDEVDICRALEFLLIKDGHDVVAVHSAEKALEVFGKKRFSLVLTDLKMEGMSGIELLEKIRVENSDIPVLLMTAFASVEGAVDAMKKGAQDYIVKPFINDDVIMTIRRILRQKDLEDENTVLLRQLSNRMAASDFIGNSSSVSRLFADIEKVAPTRSSILLLGESGTGKSLVAEVVHKNSPRRERPFLSINCSAIPETLLESELFGYKKGAFTGANANKKGLFEAADGGTLFLDEIGDMPISVQSKLLKVLEAGLVMPLGDTKTVEVDVRIIAATNQDLAGQIKEGQFREDLYYRLDVIQFTIPPLRERRDDIPALVNHFIEKFARVHGKGVTGIEDDALEALTSYDWRGNTRELMNVIERAVVMSPSKVITLSDLPDKIMESSAKAGAGLKEALSVYERKIIADCLKGLGGNKEDAAKELAIDLATLYRKMKKLDIK